MILNKTYLNYYILIQKYGTALFTNNYPNCYAGTQYSTRSLVYPLTNVHPKHRSPEIKTDFRTLSHVSASSSFSSFSCFCSCIPY